MLDGLETALAFPPLTSGLQCFTVPEVSDFPGLRPAMPKEENEWIQGQDQSFRSQAAQQPGTGRLHRSGSDPASVLGIHILLVTP